MCLAHIILLTVLSKRSINTTKSITEVPRHDRLEELRVGSHIGLIDQFVFVCAYICRRTDI